VNLSVSVISNAFDIMSLYRLKNPKPYEDTQTKHYKRQNKEKRPFCFFVKICNTF